MKEHTCQMVSEEELVAYADGELSADEAEQIAAHIATCPDCQTFIEALERSLQITQAIWQTGRAQWPETHSLNGIMPYGQPLRKAVAVAASVLLILSVSVLSVLLSEQSEPTPTISDDAKVAELRRKIADSADAARLLAAAELLSRYPEADSLVKERYRHIAETYPETAAAAEARLRIQ